MREFTCKGCSNECDIRQFTIGDEKTYWGDKCSDRYRKRAKVDKEPIIRDLVEFRNALCYSYVTEAEDYRRPAAQRQRRAARHHGHPPGHVHVRPAALLGHLLQGVRLRRHASRARPTRRSGRWASTASVAEPCFPIRVAHGHVAELLEAGVDHIFIPNQLNEETDHPEIESHACPWGQTLPHVIRLAPALRGPRGQVPRSHPPLPPRPRVRARQPCARRSSRWASRPGWSTRPSRRPTRPRPSSAAACCEAGADALATLEEHDELGIVLVGRPYNIYDAGVNMDIPAKLRRYYGVNVIPLDFLPLWGKDTRDVTPNMFWNYGRKILQAAKVVARAPQPAHHLHDQLQVRPRLLHQALHPRGLAGARSWCCSSTSTPTTPAP